MVIESLSCSKARYNDAEAMLEKTRETLQKANKNRKKKIATIRRNLRSHGPIPPMPKRRRKKDHASKPLHKMVEMPGNPSATLFAIAPVAHRQRRLLTLPALDSLALIDPQPSLIDRHPSPLFSPRYCWVPV